MKKYYTPIVLFSIMLLASCGKNDEPTGETNVGIVLEFNQDARVLDRSELTTAQLYEIRDLTSETFIVNNYNEFPKCSLIDEGWVDMDISFNDYSVIVNYQKSDYHVSGHSYGWTYDMSSRTYSFNTLNFISGNDLSYDSEVCLVRNAILVKKISSHSNVTSTFSQTSR